MKRILLCIALLAAVFAVGCSSGGDGDGDRDANFEVNLTDAPMTGVRAVNVTITTVRVHQSASAGGGDAGWRDVPVTAAMPVDLMRLRGGVLMRLCRTRLAAGHYQQVRLVVAQNSGNEPPLRNSVVTMGGVVHPLDMPSDIKIVHSFQVADGTTTDLRLDFSAADSMRQRGNGGYFMQPVIHASSMMR